MQSPFIDAPDDWDVLFLGPERVPGLVTNWGCPTSFEYEIGKTNSRDGAFVTYKGRKPREVSITLVTDEQGFQELNTLLQKLNVSARSVTVSPLSFGHALGQHLGIREVVLATYNPAMCNSAVGWEYTLNLIEFVPRPPASKSSSTSKSRTTDNRTFAQRGLPPDPPQP